MIHENSKAALAEESVKLNQRESAVLGAILQMGSCTDRMVKDFLSLPEMNSVRPRVTELIKKGLVFEAGSAKCEVTGKRVRVLRVQPAPGFAPDAEMVQASLF